MANFVPEQPSAELKAFAIRAMRAVAREWAVDDNEVGRLLGGNGEAWESLDPFPIERVSYLLGVYNALHSIFEPAQANAWIRRPNTGPGFGGRSALERMSGSDVEELAAVRDYLYSVAAGNG